MKSDPVLFFLPERTLNEATEYYVDIIKEAISQLGRRVVESNHFNDTKRFKTVFVMSAKWCFLVKLANPKADVITWFQGLGGEEALMSRGSKRDKAIWTLLEGFAMKFSWLNIYVSESMRKYYIKRYSTTDKNYFIMPCFNTALNVGAFSSHNKYTNPTFVYAGSLDKWQCIEQTLELYSIVEKSIPNASITLLTKQREEAVKLLNKYNIKNGKINFVPLDKLDAELQNYKYGFLIRDNHIVNNVSTPTKMNSYLANGIIPIYTNVIEDFNTNINISNAIVLNHEKKISEWADQLILRITNTKIDIEEHINQISLLFSSYYSKQYYIDKILKNSILKT